MTPWIIVLGLVSAAVADEKPLTVESSTMQPSVVLGRPMLTWWDVKIRGAGLLTGRFQFFIKSESALLATVETEELTLNGPEQRIRVILPAIDPGFALDRLNVAISFRGKRFSGNVSEQILRIPFSSKKVFVVLVGESRNARKRALRDKVIERLRFESLIPHENDRGENDDREYVKTFLASIDPTDFPSEALAYCGYDVVVLMGDEFRTLRKPQLEGLLAWIKAGGSLYVEPNGVLEPYHVEFLRNLVAEEAQGLTIQQDATGRLPPDTVPSGQPAAVVVCGLGRAAMRIEDPDHEEEFQAEAWRLISGPLWKMRSNPVEAPKIRYDAVGLNGQPTTAFFSNPDPWGLASLGYSRFRLQQSELLDRLMPDNVQMVPPWVLALILFVFVVLIGPGDYFVLGWLRSRNLTWVTFPAATVAVTTLTVWLSHAYMSEAETRRGAVVCDVGSSGDIVRTNRFELLFVASNHRVTTDVQKGLFIPLGLGSGFADNPFGPGASLGRLRMRQTPPMMINPSPGNWLDDESQIQSPPMAPIQGRIPTQFSITQDLVKWTPQMNREFSIPGTASKSEVDWSEFSLGQSEVVLIDQRQIPKTLSDRVRSRFGPRALLACFHGKDGWAYDRSAGWLSTRSIGKDEGMYLNYFNRLNARNGTVPGPAYGEAEFFRWIYHTSVAPSNSGMFTLTSQTAPKGGAMCDDLLLLDSSDSKSWLLVVVVHDQEDFIVYRKLMRIQD